MGPLALGDLIGLDVLPCNLEVLYNEFGDTKYRPHPLLRRWFVEDYQDVKLVKDSTITASKKKSFSFASGDGELRMQKLTLQKS